MLEMLLTTLNIVVAIFMLLVVLIQGGNSGGMGAAFGGGNSQGVMGASGGQSLLGKVTYAAAAIFMITTLSLTVIQGGSGKTGLRDKLKAGAAAGETTTAPVTTGKSDTDK